MTLYKNRSRFESFSVKVGTLFSNFGISPNQWTLLSLIPIFIAVYFIINKSFLIAAILFILGGFMDMIDGAVARATGKSTKIGAYLDTIVDRYVEGLIVFGLLFASLPGFYIPIHSWLFIYLFGALMTTYSKSAAKEKELISQELKGGILERAERLLLLFIGLLLAVFDPVYLTYVIVILAVLSNISGLQRISIIVNKSRVRTTIKIKRR